MYSYFFQSRQLPDGSYDRQYDQTDHARFYNELYRTGVLANKSANSFLVTAGVGKVTVAPGSVMINGYMGIEFAVTDFPVSGTRKMRVMLRLDISDDARSIELRLAGTSTAYPDPVREGNVFELCIANVDVVSGVPAVEDTRGDGALCGFGSVWGQPPYQPPTVLSSLLWDYGAFPLSLTPAQRQLVETTPSLYAQFLASRFSKVDQMEAATKTYEATIRGVLPTSGTTMQMVDNELIYLAVTNSAQVLGLDTGQVTTLPSPPYAMAAIAKVGAMYYAVGRRIVSANDARMVMMRYDGTWVVLAEVSIRHSESTWRYRESPRTLVVDLSNPTCLYVASNDSEESSNIWLRQYSITGNNWTLVKNIASAISNNYLSGVLYTDGVDIPVYGSTRGVVYLNSGTLVTRNVELSYSVDSTLKGTCLRNGKAAIIYTTPNGYVALRVAGAEPHPAVPARLADMYGAYTILRFDTSLVAVKPTDTTDLQIIFGEV